MTDYVGEVLACCCRCCSSSGGLAGRGCVACPWWIKRRGGGWRVLQGNGNSVLTLPHENSLNIVGRWPSSTSPPPHLHTPHPLSLSISICSFSSPPIKCRNFKWLSLVITGHYSSVLLLSGQRATKCFLLTPTYLLWAPVVPPSWGGALYRSCFVVQCLDVPCRRLLHPSSKLWGYKCKTALYSHTSS